MSSEAVYYKCGDVIEETATAAVTAGQVELKAGLASFAVNDYAIGDTAVYQIKGVAKVAATASESAGSAGQDVYFDASANTCTLVPVSASGDFKMGVLASDFTASGTHMYVLLNANKEGLIAVSEGKVFETVSDNKTLDAQDVGKVMVVDTDAKTITLPATVVGLEFVIMNGGADGTVLVTVSPNANDKIMGADVAGVDNKDYLNTKATAINGDYIKILGDGADGWYVQAIRGTWTQEA